MIYKQFKDLKLSSLGFGAMRLPVDSNQKIDVAMAEKMIDTAYANGVNYFDTAYGYHEGMSEVVVGNALKKHPQDTWYLADKFPGYETREVWKPAEVFEEQLKRCGVEYFDFYLLHNICESTYPTFTDQRWRIVEYLLKQKEAGRIRHLGFSAHAQMKTLKEFLDRYGDLMEMGQLEINALDWTFQDSKDKYDALVELGIPVWVMEPVRGGLLASFTEENNAKLKQLRPDESIAAWAFRWLQSLPAVQVTLSGMSTMEQLNDNLKTYSSSKPLSADEVSLYEGIVTALAERVPCTACRYCCAGCPQELDIPHLLTLYNDSKFSPEFIAPMAMSALEPAKRPDACVKCNECVNVCPQQINIPDLLEELHKAVS